MVLRYGDSVLPAKLLQIRDLVNVVIDGISGNPADACKLAEFQNLIQRNLGKRQDGGHLLNLQGLPDILLINQNKLVHIVDNDILMRSNIIHCAVAGSNPVFAKAFCRLLKHLDIALLGEVQGCLGTARIDQLLHILQAIDMPGSVNRNAGGCTDLTNNSDRLIMPGIVDVGPAKASMLASTEPVSATVFSALWLGTSFSATDLIGFAAITATVFLLAKSE